MTFRTGGPCAQWGSYARKALSHPAFQPFTRPVMFDTSATYVDVKVFNGNEVLFHWVFRDYRSDSDLSVQLQFCDEVLIRTANEGWFRPSIVISVFVGWKVSVTSFEVGARVYTIGPRGLVVASDHAMSNCELRVTARSSREGYGNDADRVEFRFRDANNRIDLKCRRTSVPGTRLSVSHISGPADSSELTAMCGLDLWVVARVRKGKPWRLEAVPRRSWKKQLDMQFSSSGPRHLRLSPMFRPLLSKVCMIRGCRSLGPWRKVSSARLFGPAYPPARSSVGPYTMDSSTVE